MAERQPAGPLPFRDCLYPGRSRPVKHLLGHTDVLIFCNPEQVGGDGANRRGQQEEPDVTRVTDLITIDRSSPIPLYFQVASRLEELIENGELAPGSRLDNEIQLADELGLSRPTMRQAIAHLVDRGMLTRKRGVGTQVVHDRVRRRLELTSLYEDLDGAHQQPRTELLTLERRTADEQVAAALRIDPGAEVTYLERLRFAAGEPLALMRNHLPVAVADLTRKQLVTGGLYAALRAAGIRLRVADQTIGARRATTAEARVLDEPRGAPLLAMTRVAYNAGGVPVEYGSHLYRASRYTFELTLMAP
ncbi:GntR family transcriptional regulator [Actinocatenispora sera]|uniref:GntR family transcriptional regulator n=1 Tax=Actinocatenispora sera TaxID=390989 RepID=A0A810L6G6_9ACTN|nr:GntR family transcriptional regulator [Actinocatenispora sera]